MAGWLLAMLAACHQKPPSWDALIAGRIADQYPGTRATPLEGGGVRVEQPGKPPRTVAVAPIAQFCQRGPRDCNYAIDQLLLELAPSPAQ